MLRYAIIDASKALYCDGVPYASGSPCGLGLARVAIVDRGQEWEQVAQPPQPVPAVAIGARPSLEVYVNGKVQLTARQDGVRWYLEGPGVECYVQQFAPGIRRYSLRVFVDKVITDLRVFVPGQGLKVTVEFAEERFPCDVQVMPNVGTLITLCDGKTPGIDNLDWLGWMLGGTIDTRLPPGSAEKYAGEIDAATQYSQVGKVWRSIDFVVQPTDSDEYFGAPLILDDSKWSPLFDGSVEDKQEEEHDLNIFFLQRIYARRGWATFGDWPHDQNTTKRVRYNDHYFTITGLYRAVVRASEPELWHDMARIASTYVRDMCWLNGWKSHGKGLAPWSGPYGVNEHWVDSESLLMAWLVDGDEFAFRTYRQWAAAWRMPTAPGRESRVAKRMCDVAFAFTAATIWRDRSIAIQEAELAREARDEPVTGRLWHPEWCDKTILPNKRRPEGIINARAFPIIQSWRPQVRYKDGTLAPDNAGPLGEGMMLLQMHALRRGEKIYGANVEDYSRPDPVSTRIFIDKRDDLPLRLRFRLGHRIEGDIHPAKVNVFNPSGAVVFALAKIPMDVFAEDAAGYQVAEYQCEVPGPRGRWKVEVSSYALALYAPISEWREVQDGSSWKYPAY